MPTESPTALAIRDKVESAALEWVAARIASQVAAVPADAPLWAPVELKRRKEQTDRKYPRAVFDAPESPEDEAVEGLYRVQLDVYLGTSGDERPTPAGFADLAIAHQRRTGFLEEVLGYGLRADFIAWVASPACPVKGIQIYDIYVETGRGDQTERHWFDQITYTVVAALRDEPAL